MIKAIIFDFAGVITREGFLPVLSRNLRKKYVFDEGLFTERFVEFENDYMLGKMTARDFWNKVCVSTSIPFEDFERIFATAYELNEKMVDLIKKIKSNYKTYLLTDNFETLSNNIKENKDVRGLFDKMFFSNETGLLKETAGAFEYVLDRIQESGENCIFTDDKGKNLIQANKLGIKTILFENFDAFKEKLDSLGVAVD